MPMKYIVVEMLKINVTELQENIQQYITRTKVPVLRVNVAKQK